MILLRNGLTDSRHIRNGGSRQCSIAEKTRYLVGGGKRICFLGQAELHGCCSKSFFETFCEITLARVGEMGRDVGNAPVGMQNQMLCVMKFTLVKKLHGTGTHFFSEKVRDIMR